MDNSRLRITWSCIRSANVSFAFSFSFAFSRIGGFSFSDERRTDRYSLAYFLLLFLSSNLRPCALLSFSPRVVLSRLVWRRIPLLQRQRQFKAERNEDEATNRSLGQREGTNHRSSPWSDVCKDSSMELAKSVSLQRRKMPLLKIFVSPTEISDRNGHGKIQIRLGGEGRQLPEDNIRAKGNWPVHSLWDRDFPGRHCLREIKSDMWMKGLYAPLHRSIFSFFVSKFSI